MNRKFELCPGRFSTRPVERSSTATTWFCGLATSFSASELPMNPAPPVIKILVMVPGQGPCQRPDASGPPGLALEAHHPHIIGLTNAGAYRHRRTHAAAWTSVLFES